MCTHVTHSIYEIKVAENKYYPNCKWQNKYITKSASKKHTFIKFITIQHTISSTNKYLRLFLWSQRPRLELA